MCAIDKLSGQEDLYGSSIAVAIRFLNHSLFTRLIPLYNYEETEFSRKKLSFAVRIRQFGRGGYRLPRCYFRMTIFREAVDSGVVNW